VYIGCFGLFMVTLSLNKFLTKITDHLIFIMALLFCAVLVSYSVLNIHKQETGMQEFLRGWAFGSAQIIIINQCIKLSHKLLAVILCIGIRYGVLSGFGNLEFTADVFVQNILADLITLYMFYQTERRERMLFQSFFEYRQELNKFKDLLDNYWPQSITILEPRNQTSLFSNKAFTKLFDQWTPLSTTPQTSRKGSSTVEKEQVYDLFSLDLNIEAIRSLGVKQDSTEVFSNPKSLKEFMTDLIQNKFYGQSAFSLTTSYVTQGQKRSFDAMLMPITWDREDAVAVILNDITYRENILALKIADQNKEFLIATVSHELRTPLNGIIGILQIAESKTNEPEITEYLSLCKDNATLLLNLVNSILDLQQIRNGKIRLYPSKVQVAQLLKDTIKLFHYQSAQKKIQLQLRLGKNVPEYIHTDANRLKQILINLIGNAIKFTFTGGVTISAEESETSRDCIKISVSDTGIGIKEESRERLFKMYGKLEETESINKNGVGLGLTISESLARLLNEKKSNKGIEVESELGVGTKFWFNLAKNCDVEENFSLKHNNARRRAVTAQSNKKTSVYEDQNIPTESEPAHKTSEDYGNMNANSELQAKIWSHRMFHRISLDNIETSAKLYNVSSNDNLMINCKQVSQGDAEAFQRQKSPFKNQQVNNKNSQGTNDENEYNEFFKVKGNKGRILVVDDNPFNLMIAKKFIEILGYVAEAAMNGKEAIEKVKNCVEKGEVYQLILMDIQMPVMDGLEATAKLRDMKDNKEIPEIPVIALTANTSEEDKKRCFEHGMIDHIAKPLLIETLKETLMRFEKEKIALSTLGDQ